MKVKSLVIFSVFCFSLPAYAEPSPEGVWNVVGEDDAGTHWKAKLVLKSVDEDYPPKKFKGYFDWKGNNGMNGREYIVQANFDYDTRVLKLIGTELEDAHPGIKTTVYTVKMNYDATKLDDGSWRSCGVVPGVWKATRALESLPEDKPKKGKVRKEIPRERCDGPECVLTEE